MTKPDAVLDALRRHSRVSMFAAPTMLTRLVHAPAGADADLRNLRTIFYGGGPMYVADLERALKIFGLRLYQVYGQGESPMTITGLSKRMHAEEAHPRWRDRLGSCGGPLMMATASCRRARSARSSPAATASLRVIGRTRRPVPRLCAADGCTPAISAALTRTGF